MKRVFTWMSKFAFALTLYCITTLKWLAKRKLAPLFHPIRSNSKTKRDSRFGFPALCVGYMYFEFWLVHWIVHVLCDWPGRLLWFRFYGTQLKTALYHSVITSSTCTFPSSSSTASHLLQLKNLLKKQTNALKSVCNKERKSCTA